MTAGEIIIFCKDNGIQLTPTDRGTIKVRAARKAITEDLKSNILKHKNVLLQVLNYLDIFEGENC